MNNVIAIIPARGDSKGILNKNIVNFCGKPLLVWSIEQIKQAKGISSVWVSSDSKKILSIAEKFGANTIHRPSSLAKDTSSTESALLHAIEKIEEQGKPIDLVLAAQATSPLRETKDIEKALKDFKTQQCDSMFSCAVLKDFFIWKKLPNSNFISFNYDYRNRKRHQEIFQQYVENGSFYLFKPEILRKTNNRLGGKIGITKMDFWKTFEIDSLEDLEMCEVLMKHYLLKNKK